MSSPAAPPRPDGLISGLRSRGPASINSTRVDGSALSLLASTQPAEPAPTMMKSAFMRLLPCTASILCWIKAPRPSTARCARAQDEAIPRMRSRTHLLILSSAKAKAVARVEGRPAPKCSALSDDLLSSERGDLALGEAALLQTRIGVGAERRRGSRRRLGGIVAYRAGDHPRAAVVADAAALGDKRVVERGFQIIDRRRGHPSGEMPQPLFGCPRRQPLVEQPVPLVAVGEPVLEAAEARIARPFRPAQAFAQDPPEFLLVAHDKDKAVPGAVELARHQRGMAGARFAGLHMPGIQIPGREIGEVLQRRIEQADIEVALLAGLPRRKYARDKRKRRKEPGHQIDDRQPHPGGRPVRLAGQ